MIADPSKKIVLVTDEQIEWLKCFPDVLFHYKVKVEHVYLEALRLHRRYYDGRCSCCRSRSASRTTSKTETLKKTPEDVQKVSPLHSDFNRHHSSAEYHERNSFNQQPPTSLARGMTQDTRVIARPRDKGQATDNQRGSGAVAARIGHHTDSEDLAPATQRGSGPGVTGSESRTWGNGSGDWHGVDPQQIAVERSQANHQSETYMTEAEWKRHCARETDELIRDVLSELYLEGYSSSRRGAEEELMYDR